MQNLHVVTGAFGYSGSRIASRLLALPARGRETCGGSPTTACVRLRTLTNKPPSAHPLEPLVERAPLDFADPSGLVRCLKGAQSLVNTYWVRFSEAGFSMARAVENSRILFEAARTAGVQRIVHVSITNPSRTSPYEYFRGKAEVEAALEASGVPHTILRPAVLFGGGDILINNIAWGLRHLPVFGLFGRGDFRLQPIHVDDFAELAAAAALGDPGRPNETFDAVGPEVFTYRELALELRSILGVRTWVAPLPRGLALGFARGFGRLMGDVMLTREEVGALMDDLLVSAAPALGTTQLTDWARCHTRELGRHYACELHRRQAV